MVSRLVHRDQSRVYLEQAKEELRNGELLQASEKGWGAASQIVKAVAEERGWEHNGHWFLHDAVSSLVAETGDRDLRTLFSAANQLHTNFYEGWLGQSAVAQCLDEVERFVEKVEALLEREA